jgi:hypothetical protein
MSFICKIGIHNWSMDCEKCTKCGKTREAGHDWSKDCNECSICGKTQTDHHNFTGWFTKEVDYYHCGSHRISTVGMKRCTTCGKEEICRDHDLRLIDTRGPIYDYTEYYRCSNCGLTHNISYNI